jgi:3-oxoacyl-[acyl-carrier-protein] synthase III
MAANIIPANIIPANIIPANTNGIRDKAAIVGIGETEFSWNSGRSELQLASEAIKAACDDAGIAPQDIDGLIRYDMESNHETLLVQSLGIKNLRH